MGCHRTFEEQDGLLNLLPTAEDTEIEQRGIQVYDNLRVMWEEIKLFEGIKSIVSNWSSTRIEKVNVDLLFPYLGGTKVLEVGCGRGNLTTLIAQCADVAAFDISRGYLNYAKELGNLDDAFCFQGNVCSVPFESKTFNVVVATEVLEHLLDLDGAMKEFVRVLKPGGIIVASVPNMIMDLHPLELLIHLRSCNSRRHLFRLLRRQESASSNLGIYDRPFLPKQFRKLFESYGFEIVKHRTSMLYFWRLPYQQILLFGDRYFPNITKWLVSHLIKSSDALFDKELPLIKWVGMRQHILARKAG